MGPMIVRFGMIGALLTLSISTAASAQDDAAVVANRIVTNLMKAWNSHDGKAYAAEFWPDAEFVNVFGGIMNDQKEIASRTDAVLKGALSGRQLQMTIRKVRQLAPNVIVVDSEDTDTSRAKGVVTRLKLILERRGDVWRAVAAQNTRVSTPTF